jgi:hypothetical protein
MTRYLKIFLRDRLNQSIQLAGFGKHPAWDDHIDDFGLTTETLVTVRRILYSEGIASQVSSGAWNQLEESKQAFEFDHRFVWSREAQSVIGGIWASSDGKGRGHFPIVVCLQIGVNGWRAVRSFLAPVEQLGADFQRAKEQKKFRDVFAEAQQSLSRNLVRNGPASPDEGESEATAETRSDSLSNSISEVSGCEPPEQRQETVLDGMVALSQGIKKYQKQGGRERQGSAHLRLPAISARRKENLEFWTGYLETRLDFRLPCLTIASPGLGPIDIIAGEPEARQFFCLRAPESGLPMTPVSKTDKRFADARLAAKVYLQSFEQGVIQPVKEGLSRHWWPFK